MMNQLNCRALDENFRKITGFQENTSGFRWDADVVIKDGHCSNSD